MKKTICQQYMEIILFSAVLFVECVNKLDTAICSARKPIKVLIFNNAASSILYNVFSRLKLNFGYLKL